MNDIAYLGGGLLLNGLCGACIGGTVGVIFRHRMRPRPMGVVIGIACALLVGACMAVILKTHGEGFSFYSAGLIIYPFLNRITLELLRIIIPLPYVDMWLMTLVDLGFMTIIALSTCKLIIRRQNKRDANKSVGHNVSPGSDAG